MSSIYAPQAGIGNAASYMVSGRPFLTGGQVPSSSMTEDGAIVEFPMITKSIYVINTGTIPLAVHFASREDPKVMDNYHYILLNGNPVAIFDNEYDTEAESNEEIIGYVGAIGGSNTLRINCKTRRIYLSVGEEVETDESRAAFSLYAELTNIREEYVLTGSGITE
jgi:hypothetical protein